MARPKKDKKDRRTFRLPHIRCTEAELAMITSHAKDSGMSVSEYVRFLALNSDIISSKPANDNGQHTNDFGEAMIYELHRIGNNLNQLTKRYHQDRKEPVGLQSLFPMLEKVLDHVFKRLNIE